MTQSSVGLPIAPSPALGVPSAPTQVTSGVSSMPRRPGGIRACPSRTSRSSSGLVERSAAPGGGMTASTITSASGVGPVGEMREIDLPALDQGEELRGVDGRRAERDPLHLGREAPEGRPLVVGEPIRAQALDERRVECAPRVAERPVGAGLAAADADGDRALDLLSGREAGRRSPALPAASFEAPSRSPRQRSLAGLRSRRLRAATSATISTTASQAGCPPAAPSRRSRPSAAICSRSAEPSAACRIGLREHRAAGPRPREDARDLVRRRARSDRR